MCPVLKLGVALTTKGDLYIFGVKRNDVVIETTQSVGNVAGSLTLGGAMDGLQNKIFAATKCEVKGYTKKGKSFLSFATNLGEPASLIRVQGAELVVCSGNIYNHYHDCRDTNYVVLGDKINDALLLPLTKLPTLITVLACQDRNLCTVKESRVRHTIECSGVPSVLHLLHNTGGETGEDVLCGMADGKLALFRFSRARAMEVWCLTPRPSKKIAATGVTALDCYKLTDGTQANLLLGRDDGSLEIYSFKKSDEEPPELVFRFECEEKIAAIQTGFFSSPELIEILVATQSGRIFGLCQQDKTQTEAQTTVRTKSARNQMGVLKSEIEELEMRIRLEKLKVSDDSLNEPTDTGMVHINYQITLVEDSFLHKLTVQCSSPIETIVFCTDGPIQFHHPTNQDGATTMSHHVIQCDTETFRAEILFSYTEGITHELASFLIPAGFSPKFSLNERITLQPLCYHVRMQEPMTNRLFCMLEVRGHFSQSEAHAWLSRLAREVPEPLPVEEVATLHFRSLLTGNFLTVDYRKGEMIFLSNDPATLCIVQQTLKRMARNLNYHVTFNDTAAKETLESMIKELHTAEEIEENARMNKELDKHSVKPEIRQILGIKDKNLKSVGRKIDILRRSLRDCVTLTNNLKGNPIKEEKQAAISAACDERRYDDLLTFL